MLISSIIAAIFIFGLTIYERWRWRVDYQQATWQTWLTFPLALCYVWASLIAPWWLKIIMALIFTLAILTDYGYRAAFQRPFTPQDIITIFTPLDLEIGHDAMSMYFDRWLLPPIIAYFILLTLALAPPQPLYANLILLAMLIGHAMLYPVSSPTFPTVSMASFCRALIFTLGELMTEDNSPRQPLTFRAETAPRHNIIFIVDESVRADHLSLNGYHRPTTPYLESLAQRGLLYNWGMAMACAPCSLLSNNLLLCGLHQLPDPDFQHKKWPTLFQYAKAMGYQTHWFNATSNQFWLGTRHDKQHVDHWWPRSAFQTEPRYDIDFTLARQLATHLSESTGHFIWVNKRGLHFDYNSHYPAPQATWTPTQFDPKNQATIANSYDNALRYNLDTFFQTLLESNLLQNSTIIYTSDHSQTLSEHGETWTHCYGQPNELGVPLFMLTAQPQHLDTRYPASHCNIFATLLDLMGVPPEQRAHPYAPSLLTAHAHNALPRRYFHGDLRGRWHAQWLPFD